MSFFNRSYYVYVGSSLPNFNIYYFILNVYLQKKFIVTFSVKVLLVGFILASFSNVVFIS